MVANKKFWERVEKLVEMANRATRSNDYVAEMLSITSSVKVVDGKPEMRYQAHFGMFDSSPGIFDSAEAALDALEANINKTSRGE